MAKTAELKDRFNQFEASLWDTRVDQPIYSDNQATFSGNDKLLSKAFYSITDQVRVDIRNFEENDNEEIMTVDNLNIPVTPEVGESYPLPSFSVV